MNSGLAVRSLPAVATSPPSTSTTAALGGCGQAGAPPTGFLLPLPPATHSTLPLTCVDGGLGELARLPFLRSLHRSFCVRISDAGLVLLGGGGARGGVSQPGASAAASASAAAQQKQQHPLAPPALAWSAAAVAAVPGGSLLPCAVAGGSLLRELELYHCPQVRVPTVMCRCGWQSAASSSIVCSLWHTLSGEGQAPPRCVAQQPPTASALTKAQHPGASPHCHVPTLWTVTPACPTTRPAPVGHASRHLVPG